jgi:signal-transduction protein with cAMP-binding, CBS, and nucleotidyltransferase domain
VRCADYLTKVVVAGKSSKDIKVSTIMTPEHVLKTVAPGDTVLAAMELMIDNNFRHVPVVRGYFPCGVALLWAHALLSCSGSVVIHTHCPQVDDGDYLGMVSIRDAVSSSFPGIW